MSNHIHLIITTKTEEQNASAIIIDFKKYKSKEITKAIHEVPERKYVKQCGLLQVEFLF